MAATPKFDAYQDVTDAIVAALEAGTKPWVQDWQGGSPMPQRVTGDRYRGINVLLLWMAAAQKGFNGRTWMTFKQAQELGGMVRKGEHGSRVVFFKKLTVEREGSDGDRETAQVPMIRTFTVFNTDQIDGLPAKFAAPVITLAGGTDRDAATEAALRSCGATIVEQGNSAFYRPSDDVVHMPPHALFTSASGFAATLAHELCHWTGHASRLDRAKANRFGSATYAMEELIAELGAAMVGGRLGFVGEHIENHAAYLAGWLKCLKEDKRAIFRAASAAQAAADMVLANAEIAQADDAGDELADETPAPIALPIAAPIAQPAAAQFAFAL